MNEKDVSAYVNLAMKNLFFAKLQRENVVSEVNRLIKSKDINEVNKLLNK
ncbi:hypothetical protein DOK76_06510 [Vagococcus sp. DIV0080]|uniref:Uncharacterized protein n=1 Tax=Candidatus Vagococcus giribetii TaxID=2230876 RepID=A0ABS3HU05_9ENTE|nr:hypothetical protein [Vagococcus sp. DIV0080]MBO0476717.1 hypothetical protein [Vagococcus sp. DIV0080]